jgi:hypothetical protein
MTPLTAAATATCVWILACKALWRMFFIWCSPSFYIGAFFLGL